MSFAGATGPRSARSCSRGTAASRTRGGAAGREQRRGAAGEPVGGDRRQPARTVLQPGRCGLHRAWQAHRGWQAWSVHLLPGPDPARLRASFWNRQNRHLNGAAAAGSLRRVLLTVANGAAKANNTNQFRRWKRTSACSSGWRFRRTRSSPSPITRRPTVLRPQSERRARRRRAGGSGGAVPDAHPRPAGRRPVERHMRDVT